MKIEFRILYLKLNLFYVRKKYIKRYTLTRPIYFVFYLWGGMIYSLGLGGWVNIYRPQPDPNPPTPTPTLGPNPKLYIIPLHKYNKSFSINIGNIFFPPILKIQIFNYIYMKILPILKSKISYYICEVGWYIIWGWGPGLGLGLGGWVNIYRPQPGPNPRVPTPNWGLG